MIFRLLIFAAVFISSNLALAQHELQIYVPGIQFRYEEGADQHLDIRNYTTYSVNYMFDRFLLGFEYNTNQENSGGTALGVKSSAKEVNALLGFSLAKLELQGVTPNTNLEIVAFALAGSTKTEIETSLNGVTQPNTSESQSVLGLGGAVFFRLDYFIAGLDTRMMQSEAYLPKSVSVSTIKLGVNFRF